jgi:hypothetical protein
MTEQEEKVFDARVERDFQSQRECPTGRNFLAWQMREHGGRVKRNFDMGMCATFPNAPHARSCESCPWKDCGLRKEGE